MANGNERERNEAGGGEVTPPFFRPEFEEAFRFIVGEYAVLPADLAVFLPCSVQKPYSTSPSHRKFDEVITSTVPAGRAHVVVFGTCGVVPRELERMYPYASYRYNLGRCPDPLVHRSFLRIETVRVAAYLEKTQDLYRRRVAYCLGDFRAAMTAAVERTGVPVTIAPAEETIAAWRDPSARFPDGSLSCPAYLADFERALSAAVRR
jgi:archaeosine synthase